MRALCLGLLLVACAGCVGPEDTPVKVVDLRVLGMRVDPPEVMAPRCQPGAPPVLSAPLTFQALVVDPGQHRPVRVSLTACSRQGDRDCSDAGTTRLVLLEEQELTPEEVAKGELTRVLDPTASGVEQSGQDFVALMTAAAREPDTFGGAGVLRLPLVLHVKAGEEEVYAQKLMVFSCKLFPQQEANENPELPGLVLEGAPWSEEAPRSLEGEGPFAIAPLDFSALERPYVVPTLEQTPRPLSLTESWKISWHTDYGRIEPGETGGTDVGGFEGRHNVQWLPPSKDAEPRERVRVWAVVRDGRGGESWLERSFRYDP